MDVYCPACGKKGRIDDARIPASGVFARCPGCRSRLWINKAEGVSLAGEPSPAPPAREEVSPESPVPPEPSPIPSPPASSVPPQRPEPASSVNQPPAPPVPAADPPVVPPVQQPQPSVPSDPVPGPTAGFEITPDSPIQAQPGIEQQPEKRIQGIQCNLCGNIFPDHDMVRFGETMVCGACKPQYVQMMRTGVSRPDIFRYGGFWIRFIAKFIDGIILGILQGMVMVPMFIFMFRSAPNTSGPDLMASFATANIFINLLSISFGATYTTLFLGKYEATPGKMAFGLKVVTPDGGRITYMRAFGRYFAEMVSAFTLLIGYIMAGFDSQKRSLHDRICSTRVIRK